MATAVFESNILTSVINFFSLSSDNGPVYTTPIEQGSYLCTYLFNILIQTYAFLASYPSMAVVLPFLVRFRTVIDYRLTHEYFHLHEKADRHSYFQGLLTTALNAYFATLVVSILLGQPVSLLITSTPLYITWFVYSLLWAVPIKVLHTLSKYTRWLPATAAIVYEYLLCIFTIERAMRVSYQQQPNAVPVSSVGNALEDITPTQLLRIPAAISIPFAILCGFLILQGNPLLAEMINIHGNFRVKTPSQVKNPFFGNGKIALNMALIFVSFVTVFVPAHIFLAGAKNAPPNLLPNLQVLHNNFNDVWDTEELCISQQHHISDFCYQDWILSICPDHTPKTAHPNEPKPQRYQKPQSSLFFSPLETLSSLSSDVLCDTTLALIHILGLKDCDLEQHRPTVSSLVSKQHETHQAASKAITARLHWNIIADSTDLHWAHRKSTKKGEVFVPQPFAHVYPTIPIDQVGQPLVARISRETIGSRIDFYSRGIRGVTKIVGYGLRQAAQLVGQCFERFIPLQFISHLHPQLDYTCRALSRLSIAPVEKAEFGRTTTHNSNNNNNNNQSGAVAAAGEKREKRLKLTPGPEFHQLVQSAVPPDTLFFVHVPNHDNTSTHIYPITFTLAKAFMMLAWFVVHWVHLLRTTRFQSKCSAKLQRIWDSPVIDPSIITRLGKKQQPRTPGVPKLTPIVLANNPSTGSTNYQYQDSQQPVEAQALPRQKVKNFFAPPITPVVRHR